MERPAGHLGSVGRVRAMAVDPVWLAGWVAASCAAQAVPVKVTDTGVLSRVGALLGVRARATRAPGAPAPSTRGRAAPSQPPHGLHAVGVEDAGSGARRCDDGVVEDRGDDGGLPVQAQGGPAVA